LLKIKIIKAKMLQHHVENIDAYQKWKLHKKNQQHVGTVVQVLLLHPFLSL